MTITIVIFTVFTLARGIMPRELARLLPRSTTLPFRNRSTIAYIVCIVIFQP